eukprot:COSAG01_NODE_4817_length_4724_cov_3.025081_9_plen_91_part_00
MYSNTYMNVCTSSHSLVALAHGFYLSYLILQSSYARMAGACNQCLHACVIAHSGGITWNRIVSANSAHHVHTTRVLIGEAAIATISAIRS